MSSLPLWLAAFLALLCACDWLTFPCPDGGQMGGHPRAGHLPPF